ncbi:acyl-CoA-binding domain-containing protein 6 [Bombina bombina]|uniref:acyl-CoA-binding domain-containing protein 6 n=1 Tax=Bombina bombina TaxID=8345 RepID=UPI00235B293D|nr:acyl-CoA-binding domain-containing protein 6 [Bombina bombina]
MACSPQPAGLSSSEECGELGELSLEDTEEVELRRVFEQAAKHVQNLVHVASTEQLLYLYARFKQVKVGKCTTSKPGFFDFEGRKKWEAWKALGDYSVQQAMQDYIDTVKKLDPSWTPKDCEETSKPLKTTFGGPVVSCLYQVQEIIRDEDKNIFDYCRENDITRVSGALASGSIDVNIADEEGRSILHWACDRGHTELVSVLICHNAHVNMQDSEGQTPLHYASACEFPDIVGLLLDHGADPSLVDNDGFQPHEATDSKQIREMLKQDAVCRQRSKPLSCLLEIPQ